MDHAHLLSSTGVLKDLWLFGWLLSVPYYLGCHFFLSLFSFFVAFNFGDFYTFYQDGTTTCDQQWLTFYG